MVDGIGAKGTVKTKGRGKVRDGSVIQDPRFARLHSDPRFQRMPRSKSKVAIDSRFQHMFSDKSFSDPHALDKRGRKTTKKDRHSLRRYYKVDEEEEKQAEVRGADEEGTSSESEEVELPSHETPNAAGRLTKKRPQHDKIKLSGASETGHRESGDSDLDLQEEKVSLAKIRSKAEIGSTDSSGKEVDSSSEDVDDAREGVASDDSSDGDSVSSSESSSSDDESDLDEEPQVEEDEKVPTTDQETRRLALVNMDWQHIKAIDLFVLLKSFLPKGGDISSIAVYPSEFGLQQMTEEERQGPQAIFERDENDDDHSNEDNMDMEKLRHYEKAKLRYYYAVVECDSAATANSLYTACDGLEFERTSNTLDLRFIPEHMEFKHAARDSVSEVPSEYRAPEFETRALQHSRVKLTWDDDEPVRVKALQRNFTSDQLNEMDFQEYLASESEDDAEEGNDPDTSGNDDSKGKQTLRDKYRSLLLGNVTNEDDNKQEEMEVTFHIGLDDLNQRLLDKREEKKRGEETVWEAYLRKKKEKKKQRGREQSLANESDAETDQDRKDHDQGAEDSFFQHDENPFDDPFFSSGDGKQGLPSTKASKKLASKGRVDRTQELEERVMREEKKIAKREEKEIAKREEERSKAELELLLMDDHCLQNAAKGFNLRKQKQKEKVKRKKNGQQQEVTAGDRGDMHSSVDLDDPRFSSLFTSHHFAIEPTDPQYKRSSTQLGILADKQRKRLHGPVAVKDSAALENKANVADPDETSKTRKVELSSIVHSLKRKVRGWYQ